MESKVEQSVSDVERPNTGSELPNLGQALAEFKRELKNQSKNELVRLAANFYARLSLALFQINDMESQIKILQEQLSSQKQSKESHD